MATATAAQFVSMSSHLSNHPSEPKANSGLMGLRSQSTTHHGLRYLNKIDKLQMRTQSKVQKKVSATENVRPSGKIICGHGMNLVFVGAEVGPWSKTGGLGDVLGGLPPALAVSIGAGLLGLITRFIQLIQLAILFQARGHRVMTVSPRYDQYKDAWDTSVVVQVFCHGFCFFSYF